MAWLRVDDAATVHPKVLSAGNETFGFVVRCAAWSAANLTDCFVTRELATLVGGTSTRALTSKAVRAGLLIPAQDQAGARGWTVVIDDELLHLKSRDEVLVDRQHRAATRQQDVTIEVRRRDGDQCRYCGNTVNFGDRKGGRGGTYDHIDPDADELVVACRSCNSAKKRLKPGETFRPLLPAPEQPWYGPKTLEWFSKYEQTRPEQPGTQPAAAHPRPTSQVDPAPRPGPTPDPAPARTAPAADAATPGPARSGSDLDPTTSRVADHPPPGRDGSRDGTAPAVRTRDGPSRPRGSRGRRGRAARAP